MIKAHETTITLTGTEQKLQFAEAHPYYWVHNLGGSEVLLSLKSGITYGKDGVVIVPSRSGGCVRHGMSTDTVYVSGTGTVQVIGTYSAHCPFKAAPKGGGEITSDGAVSVLGTADYPLLAINLYGKSTQDGTPTPEEPVDIVSIGDDGAVEVVSCGKNLIEGSQDWSGEWACNNSWTTAEETYNGLIVKTKSVAWEGLHKKLYVESGRTYTFSCYAKGSIDGIIASIYAVYPLGNAEKIENSAVPYKVGASITLTNEWTRLSIRYVCTSSGYINPRIEKRDATGTLYVCGYQLEESMEMTDYESYKGSTATVTSALPLCSVGDVRDELIHNIDGTGKVIKRTGVVTFDGSDDESWYLSSNYSRIVTGVCSGTAISAKSTYDVVASLCNRLTPVAAVDTWLGKQGISFETEDAKGHIHICISSLVGNSDLTAWTSWLADNPLTVVYQLAEPQEIELSAAEMSALRALQSYSGVTNVYNDEGAEMSVKVCTNTMLSEYVYPIIKGQQKRIEELEAAVLSLGGNV